MQVKPAHMQIMSSNIKFTTDLPKAAFVIIINGLMILAMKSNRALQNSVVS